MAHYENFPVASLLLPSALRPAVRAIYRFARTADDIADEGDAPASERLRALAALGAQLDAIESGAPSDWPDLAVAVGAHALDVNHLRALLSAFAQDITVHRYADEMMLLDYCRRSANPVGRLLLRLYRRTEPELLAWSDSICTGLQLVNFWQDIAIDWRKGRVYIPQEALSRHGVDAQAIEAQRADSGWQRLTRELTATARALLQSGAPLARALGGRIGFELRLVLEGGLRIAERLDAVRGDVFRHRPKLRALDWPLLWTRALLR